MPRPIPLVRIFANPAFAESEFLRSLDPFYVAIENAARGLEDPGAPGQQLLNTVYERFFQGYSVKVADMHGIIYTPQPIVDFMCASEVTAIAVDGSRRSR